MRSLLHDFLAMIYPEYCRACKADLEKGEDLLCTDCRFSLPRTQSHADADNLLIRRFWGKIPVTHAFAYLTFVKGGKVQHLLHQLKYRNQPEVGKLLGRWYGADLQAAGFENKFDLIVPVPLHPAKFRKRGYNQSDAIAEGLSEGMGIAWSDKTVIRTIFTDTQTHKKRYARYQNVASVFAVAEPEKIQGRHILVVDDVMTTGSTFEACANTILQNGASAISVLALAAAK